MNQQHRENYDFSSERSEMPQKSLTQDLARASRGAENVFQADATDSCQRNAPSRGEGRGVAPIAPPPRPLCGGHPANHTIRGLTWTAAREGGRRGAKRGAPRACPLDAIVN